MQEILPPTERLRGFVYLIPVFGFFPALWVLYRRRGSRQERVLCRLSVTLALVWLAGHVLVEGGAAIAPENQISWLIFSSILTSSYFLVNTGLMFRLWRNRPIWLPGISRLSDRLP
ncbi:MAG: hypothetical protein HC925_09425 [Coleofasciculaceae cyanobacterium SM2_3_26]|nr:hypothetical protein [Coleofasciculaceae cyanobacterium SM2_3_26]